MSLKLNVVDPNSRNIAKLLIAIGEYCETTDQKIAVEMEIDFPKEKKKKD